MTQSFLAQLSIAKSIGLSAPDWLAILRIGLGLWWLESFRHKDKKAWFERGSGIAWAKSVAEKSARVKQQYADKAQ